MEQSKCYKRLKLLVRKGLAQRKLMLQNQPGVYHVTRAGLKTVGIADMAVPTVSLQSFLHDLAVVWEQISLERTAALVLSEREMRYYEKTTAEDYRVQIPGHLADDARTHRPDLIFRVGAKGGLHAVEVELALKSEARLVAILSAYAASSQYVAVVYCVPSAELIKRLRTIGDKVGIGDRLKLVTIQRSAAA